MACAPSRTAVSPAQLSVRPWEPVRPQLKSQETCCENSGPCSVFKWFSEEQGLGTHHPRTPSPLPLPSRGQQGAEKRPRAPLSASAVLRRVGRVREGTHRGARCPLPPPRRPGPARQGYGCVVTARNRGPSSHIHVHLPRKNIQATCF